MLLLLRYYRYLLDDFNPIVIYGFFFGFLFSIFGLTIVTRKVYCQTSCNLSLFFKTFNFDNSYLSLSAIYILMFVSPSISIFGLNRSFAYVSVWDKLARPQAIKKQKPWTSKGLEPYYITHPNQIPQNPFLFLYYVTT